MARPRTLWKVTQGFTNGLDVDPSTEQRPESKAKVYAIYVPNNVNGALAKQHLGQGCHDFTTVWVDERDGKGWQLYERIEHEREGG